MMRSRHAALFASPSNCRQFPGFAGVGRPRQCTVYSGCPCSLTGSLYKYIYIIIIIATGRQDDNFLFVLSVIAFHGGKSGGP